MSGVDSVVELFNRLSFREKDLARLSHAFWLKSWWYRTGMSSLRSTVKYYISVIPPRSPDDVSPRVLFKLIVSKKSLIMK